MGSMCYDQLVPFGLMSSQLTRWRLCATSERRVHEGKVQDIEPGLTTFH